MKDLYPANLDTMTPAEFEAFLPELFESGAGNISDDPRFATFFAANPDCLALVRDLETIAETARSLFDPPSGSDSDSEESGSALEPSDKIWSNIASKLQSGEAEDN
jgi:hypothetical protein